MWNRRRLLQLALGLPLAGCERGPPSSEFTGTSFTYTSPIHPTVPTFVTTPGVTVGGISKIPWVQITSLGARWRCETFGEEEVDVSLTMNGVAQEVSVSSAQVNVVRTAPLEDRAGIHQIHEAVFRAPVGEIVRWSAVIDEEVFEGSFLSPPAPGAPFRVAFVGDTSRPVVDSLMVHIADNLPDLFLHGGDIEYSSSLSDSWTGLSYALGPVSLNCFVHFCPGNHEFEGSNEEVEMYDRLFGGQGESHFNRCHAFSFGGRRFVMVDSEDVLFTNIEGPLMGWLLEELRQHPGAVVVFHRPGYTYSYHMLYNVEHRDRLHRLFLETNVRLVMSGHVHGHERFAVDGLTYLVDGGGGASPYDLDSYRDNVESLRPGEGSLRVGKSDGYGATLLDFGPGDQISGVRIDHNGLVVDSFLL